MQGEQDWLQEKQDRLQVEQDRLGCYVVKGNFAFSVLIYTGVKISYIIISYKFTQIRIGDYYFFICFYFLNRMLKDPDSIDM